MLFFNFLDIFIYCYFSKHNYFALEYKRSTINTSFHLRQFNKGHAVKDTKTNNFCIENNVLYISKR
jgi:hypothetical protein